MALVLGLCGVASAWLLGRAFVRGNDDTSALEKKITAVVTVGYGVN